MKFYYRNAHCIFAHSVNQKALIYSTKIKQDTFLRSFQFSWPLSSSVPRLILRIGPHFAAPIVDGKKTTTDRFLPDGIIVSMVYISNVTDLRVSTGHVRGLHRLPSASELILLSSSPQTEEEMMFYGYTLTVWQMEE